MTNTNLVALNKVHTIQVYTICEDNYALISREPHTYLTHIRKLRPKKR